MSAPANLSAAHRRTSDRLGPRCALRYRRCGLFRDRSWADVRRRADHAAAGLIALGIQPGDRVAILSENRPEWIEADLAILAAGAVGVTMHAPLVAGQVEYQLMHSGARGAIVSDRAQAAKILAGLARTPAIEWIVPFEPIGSTGELACVTWDGLIARGRGGEAEVARREAAIGLDDLATILYTSGTTGPPKGVMLTHGNLLSNAEATLQVSDAGPDDVLLSWLPYSHIYARTVDLYLSMLAGQTVVLSSSPEAVLADVALTGPTWLTAVPRFYEKVWAAVEPLPADARAARLRAMFGPRLRRLSSGGAPLPKHIAQGVCEAGIPLLEGYGLTESSPVICFNRVGANRVGTVGQALPGVEVAIAPDGEILTRGPHVMAGYWADPEATAATIIDGWLHTGDVGSIDADGYLTITDRKKDILVTAGGKNIAPAELERLLTADPLIDQAVVCGDARPFVAAIVVPNLAALEAEAEKQGAAIAIDGDWVAPGPAFDLIAGRVEAAMAAVSPPERVRAFLALARPLSLDRDELTPTLKVRRRLVLDRFAEPIDDLYRAAKAHEAS